VEREPEKHTDDILEPRTIGVLMISIGTFMLLLASAMHGKKMIRIT
jgi:hypothetical protein